MALVEKVTRKIEMDEAENWHIHIRDTTHLVDEDSGEVAHRAVTHKRKVVLAGDLDGAKKEDVLALAEKFWA